MPEFSLDQYLTDIPDIELIEILEEIEWEGQYLCFHKGLSEYVLIELINYEHCPNTRIVYEFKEKVEKLREFKHENMVEMRTSKMDDEVAYIMYAITSTTRLRDVIDTHGPTSPKQALEICRDIAKVLLYCQKKNFFHGELRPSNIFLTVDDEIKIRNFFVFKKENEYIYSLLGRRPEYISPEFINFEDITIQSDIYSLGIMLYEMITGKLPFDADDYESIWKQHIESEVPSLPSEFSDYPKLNEVIHTCLKKDSKSRYQDIQELIIALNDLILTMPPELSFKRYKVTDELNHHHYKTNKHLYHKKKRPTTPKFQHKKKESSVNEGEVKTKAAPVVQDKPEDVVKSWMPIVISVGCLAFLGFFCYAIWIQYKADIPEEDEITLSKSELPPSGLSDIDDDSRYNTKKDSKIKKETKLKKTKNVVSSVENPQEEILKAEDRPEFADVRQHLKYLKEVRKRPKEEAIEIMKEAVKSEVAIVRLLANQILRDLLMEKKEDDFLDFESAKSNEEEIEFAETVFQRVENLDPLVRKDLLEELLELPDSPHARGYLALLLNDNNEEIANTVFQNLVEKKDESVLSVLYKKILANPVDENLYNSIVKFGASGETKMLNLLKETSEVYHDLFISLAPLYSSANTVEPLSKFVATNKGQAFSAALALSRLEEKGKDALNELLQNENVATRQIAYEALKEIPEAVRVENLIANKHKLSVEAQKDLSDILLTKNNTLINEEWDERKIQLLLKNKTKISDEELCEILIKNINSFGQINRQRIKNTLLKYQLTSIKVLLNAYKETKISTLKKGYVSLLSEIRHENAAKALISIYPNSKHKVDIVTGIVQLDSLALEAVIQSDLELLDKLKMLSLMESKRALSKLIELLEQDDKTGIKEALKYISQKHPNSEKVYTHILLQSKKSELLIGVVKLLKKQNIEQFFSFLMNLLNHESKVLRKEIFEKLTYQKKLLEENLLSIISVNKNEDIIYECLKFSYSKHPEVNDLFSYGFLNLTEKLRYKAVELYIKQKHEDVTLLLELYSQETDLKIKKLIVKVFSKSPHKDNLDFHLINMVSDNRSLSKASLRVIQKLKVDKVNAPKLGQTLQSEYPIEVKKFVIGKLSKYDDDKLIQYICDALPSKNEKESDLYLLNLRKYGKRSAPFLIRKMNESNNSINEIKTILNKLKVSYSFDAPRKMFVLEN